MDPPCGPRRHLPDHDPHAPQPERWLLALSVIVGNDGSGKYSVNTRYFRPTRVRNRIWKPSHQQQQRQKNATIMRKRIPIPRPMGPKLQATAHRILPSSHLTISPDQRNSGPDNICKTQNQYHHCTAQRPANVFRESFRAGTRHHIYRNQSIKILETIC